MKNSSVVSLAAGPARVRGQHFGDAGWGLGLESRVVFWGKRGIGSGLYAFANVNAKSSFFGLTLGVEFGGR